MTDGQRPAGASLWREPLLQFVLIGAALFLLHRLLNGPGDPAPREIVVSPAQVAALEQGFARTWLREPDAAELRGLIDEYVREEVYYREAIAMGLDRDDTVVRRRLRQKMEFLAEDAVEAAPPSDAELAAFLDAHRDRFAAPSATSFEQVYFSNDRRGVAASRAATQLLPALQAGRASAGPGELGDATLLPPAMTDASPRDVESVFGAEFARRLDEVPLGQWAGPIESSYGVHLVRVGARQPGQLPALGEVRPLVEREWQAEQARLRRDESYRALLAKYRVRIAAGTDTPR